MAHGVIALVALVACAACSPQHRSVLPPRPEDSPSIAAPAASSPAPRSPGPPPTSSPPPSPTTGPVPAPIHSPAPAQTTTFGTSVLGRSLTATEIGSPGAARVLLVVGCVHGDEPAGIAIARSLEALQPPPGTDVWVIEDLNPDGVTAGTRQNAHGVDLNRNFPYAWAPLGAPGAQQYSGSGPLSEPESAAAAQLIRRIRPTVSIWFHQAEDLVDLSGGDPAVERRYAGLVGLPARQLTRYPGSAVSWENVQFPGTTAFVVELPGGALSPGAAGRFARAALDLVQP